MDEATPEPNPAAEGPRVSRRKLLGGMAVAGAVRR